MVKVETNSQRAFFALLRAGLWGEGNDNLDLNPNANPNDKVDWDEVYRLAEEQSVQGLVLQGIERLKNENDNDNRNHNDNENLDDNGNRGNSQLGLGSTLRSEQPSQMLLLQWIGDALQIEAQNKKIDEAAALLTKVFNEGGFRSCVLKGQGIAQLYPKPERRQPGDVDLWAEGGREKVLKFLKNNFFGTGQVVIHHVDARIIDGVDSEIHFMPGYTWNPFLHRKLQRFFRQQADAQFSNYDSKLGFAYPTLRFNVVYILSHIYMHFLYEGIGLRQLVDYYYVIKNLSPEERHQATKDICEVGLKKFAGAVFFVLAHVCGLEEDYWVVNPDANRGALLLDEIMRGGNFGKYDERLKNREKSHLIRNNLVSFRRQLRFLHYYPLDILCIPIWKTGHWCWRKWKGYV